MSYKTYPCLAHTQSKGKFVTHRIARPFRGGSEIHPTWTINLLKAVM